MELRLPDGEGQSFSENRFRVSRGVEGRGDAGAGVGVPYPLHTWALRSGEVYHDSSGSVGSFAKVAEKADISNGRQAIGVPLVPYAVDAVGYYPGMKRGDPWAVVQGEVDGAAADYRYY